MSNVGDERARRAAVDDPSAATVALLADLNLTSLSDEGRLHYLQAIERAQSWLSSLATRPMSDLVEPAARADAAASDNDELEQASVREEVRVALALSSPAVRIRIEMARELSGRLRATQQALACGSITFVHARTLVEAAAGMDDETAQAIESRVLPRACDRPVATLRRALRSAIAALDSERVLERHELAASQRTIHRWNTQDGMAELLVSAPAPDVQLIWQALTILAGTSDGEAQTDTDPRPLGARRVDALTRLCLEAVAPRPHSSQRGKAQLGKTGDSADEHTPATPTTVASDGVMSDPSAQAPRRPRIPVQAQIVVDLPTLMGLASNPAELRGYGPIPADIARVWLADAESWRRLVTDPVDDHLLDLGPLVRHPPPGLAEFVKARDGTCTFPFCHHPAHRADLDHCEPFQADGSGGSTSAQNLGALCRYHHRVKTFMGWVPSVEADRDVVWRSPAGRTYRVPARPQRS